MLVPSGKEFYQIRYNGQMTSNGVSFDENFNLYLELYDPETNQSYQLFNSSRDGIAAVMFHDLSNKAQDLTALKTYKNKEGLQEFNCFISLRYQKTSSYFKYDSADSDAYQLPNRNKIPLQTAIDNGFDGISIYGLDKNSKIHKILMIEGLENYG